MLLLSGDIGGTKTRLLLSNYENQQLHPIAEGKFLSADYQSLEDIVTQFMDENNLNHDPLSAACFAIAGPIVDDTVQCTNLPWFIEKASLQKALNLDALALINDFAAIGYGVTHLEDADLATIQRGDSHPTAPKALIGAGTGLGVALMHHDGDQYHVLPTEGGHIDFAPTNDMQVELLQYLRKRFHRVSIERVVSGMGLVNIYRYVCDHPLYNEQENPQLHRQLHKDVDKAATIADFATQQQDPMARRALDLFIQCYGTCAGNLALTTLPYGGLYIVGGIAPKLIRQFTDGQFINAFQDKGRMSRLLESMPIKVVMNTKVGLYGAAYFAAQFI